MATDGSLDPGLKAMMNTTVTVKSRSATSRYGAPTYTTVDTSPAHVIDRQTKFTSPDGQEVASDTTVYLQKIFNINPEDDIIELPDGSTPRVVRSVVRQDENGNSHHEVVYLVNIR